MVKLYAPGTGLNDATRFYTDIIISAFENLGYNVVSVDNVANINYDDIVLTISMGRCEEIIKRKPKKIIHWFQGILPEECFLQKKNYLKKIKWYIIESLIDKHVLTKSDFNFFVSQTMVEHYQKKYGYKKDNYYIMPCFNLRLNEDAFQREKYNKPTFVYAGSLSEWQCFPQTVKLFSEIKKQLPAAEFTIFTQEKEKASKILQKYNIDAIVDYVPYQQLSQEMKKFKYGFIIRKDIEINRVATPTKMNSYLSDGIIPIYTDVIGYYKQNMSNMKYSIPLQPKSLQGLKKLFEFENKGIDRDLLLSEYKEIFDVCYNREFYVKQITRKLTEIL